jgi:hypothetical protein
MLPCLATQRRREQGSEDKFEQIQFSGHFVILKHFLQCTKARTIATPQPASPGLFAALIVPILNDDWRQLFSWGIITPVSSTLLQG